MTEAEGDELGTAEVLNPQASQTADHLWTPVVGSELTTLLGTLRLPNDASRNRVQRESISILAKCVPPTALDGSRTGLVVGYVQSGKTLSMTAVTALARDNSYPLIIVIAGTSIPLFKQSQGRFVKDLRLDTRDDRKWRRFDNPAVEDYVAMSQVIGAWKDPDVPPEQHRTVLIMVMKNYHRLEALTTLLKDLDLARIPALVFDDEADQASLNTKVRKDGQSTTYAQLLSLRGALPLHTFLQYTATPQAPLLINIIDILSPTFAEVLEPGTGYTGGKEFFGREDELIENIPADEVPTPQAVPEGAPPSLQKALRLFYVGVAAARVAAYPELPRGNRSMLIHPSREVSGHALFSNWVTSVRSAWSKILEAGTDVDRSDLLAEFEEDYADLKKTVEDIPTFDKIKQQLIRTIREAQVLEVNAAQDDGTPLVPWKDEYAHILVGGQAMDRGFTVEGLTITYLPRPPGMVQADTIQQRARFLGYKEDYIGYCRVFLEDTAAQLYRGYIEHEEDVRKRLQDFKGRPLSEWKRAFFLDTAFRPTRRSVLSNDYLQGMLSDSWFAPKAPQMGDAVAANAGVIREFTGALQFTLERYGTGEVNVHRSARARLSTIYRDLLVKLLLPLPEDRDKFTGLLLQVSRYLDDEPDEAADVFVMSQGMERKRTVDDSKEIPNLMQGRDEGTGYPGDRAIKGGGLTVQIHWLRLWAGDTVIASEVPAVAVWVPAKMAKPWLVARQDGA